MFNILDSNTLYIIVSPEKNDNSQVQNKILNDKLSNILYANEFTLLPIKGYYNEKFENSCLASPNNIDNDDLRKIAIRIIDEFDQDSVIIKYYGETYAKRLSKDGSERPLGMVLYNTEDSSNKSYIFNGMSFSFVEQKRYYFPNSKTDFKIGMIVECFSGDKWIEMKVENVELEYNDIYKLMIKYEKVRIPY